MKAGFRQSMAWLHTWSGLVVGWLLFAIFLTGAVSFYRHEISGWMRPELRQMAPSPDAASIALDRLKAIAPNARRWLVDLPDARELELGAFSASNQGYGADELEDAL